MLADDDDEASTTTGPSKGQASQPTWMRNLLERCREWEQQLPEVGFMFDLSLQISK